MKSHRRKMISFNPCFVGNRSGSGGVDDVFFSGGMFQSLFCWKSVWESIPHHAVTGNHGSFNPCFVGNRSGSTTGGV